MDRIGVAPFQVVRAEDIDARFPDGVSYSPNPGSVGLQQNIEHEFELTQQARFTKGWVSGMSVTVAGVNVTITEGLAYDRDGRRVTLLIPQTLSFSGRSNGEYYIVAYSDYRPDPKSLHIYTPQVDTDNAAEAVSVYRRVQASAKLVVLTAIPNEADDPSVVLAKITIQDGSISLSLAEREISRLRFEQVPALPYLRLDGGTMVGAIQTGHGQAAQGTDQPTRGLLTPTANLFSRPTEMVLALKGDTKQFMVETWTDGGGRYSLLSLDRLVGLTLETDAAFAGQVNFYRIPAVGGTPVSLSTHLHDDRYSRLGHRHTIGEVSGLVNELSAKAPIVSPTFQGNAAVAGELAVGGFSLTLGFTDQVSRGHSGASRALVKDAGNKLVVNYGGDFAGGVVIGGSAFGVSGNMNVAGSLDVAGTLTRGGIAVALATHLHDDRYSRLGHTHSFAEVPNLAEALATKANLNGANFTGMVDVPYLRVKAQDAVSEGGQIELAGAANYLRFIVDVQQNRLRFFNEEVTMYLSATEGLVVDRAIRAGGEISAAGVITQNGVPVALSTHLHDDRYSRLGHTHSISEVLGAQDALNLKANLNGATFTGMLQGRQFSLLPMGGAGEGGRVTFSEAAGYKAWAIDVYQRSLRMYNSDGVGFYFSPDGLYTTRDLVTESSVSARNIYQQGVPVALSTHLHDDRYALLGHTHAIAQVTGLQAALASKVAYGQSVTASLTLTEGQSSLVLMGGVNKHAYVSFYTDADPSQRTGWMGFGAWDSRTLTITNERVTNGSSIMLGENVHINRTLTLEGNVVVPEGATVAGIDLPNLNQRHNNLKDAFDAHNHDNRYALAGHTHSIGQVGGLQAVLDSKAPLNSPNFTGHGAVQETFTVRGFDFILGNGDQNSRGDSGMSRALVKVPNSALALNYKGDFTGGVVVDGPRLTVNGHLSVGGNVDFAGTLTRGGQPLALASHNHDDRYPLRSELSSAVANYFPVTGGVLRGDLSFAISRTNAVTSGIVFAGLSDNHSIRVEEYGGNEATRLVIFNEDNGDQDYTVFRSRFGQDVRDVLEVKFSAVNLSVPLTVNGTEVVDRDGRVDWSRLRGVPQLAAASHTHTVSDISGIGPLLDAKAGLYHGHSMLDVAGLTEALAGKSAVGHTHAANDLTGLASLLAGKAAVGHTHDLSALPIAASGEVSGAKLVRADDVRLSNPRVPSPHVHSISEVMGLAEAINSRAAYTHTHDLTAIPVAASGEVSGAKLVRADDVRLSNARVPLSHSHVLSDIAGLQEALNSKLDSRGNIAFLDGYDQTWSFRNTFSRGITITAGTWQTVNQVPDYNALIFKKADSPTHSAKVYCEANYEHLVLEAQSNIHLNPRNSGGVFVNTYPVWTAANAPFKYSATRFDIGGNYTLMARTQGGDQIWLGGDDYGADSPYAIGMSNPNRQLKIYSPSGAMTVVLQGRMYASGLVQASNFVTQSRRESKTNIEPYERRALDVVNATAVVRFDYKDGLSDRIGFIADDTDADLAGKEHDHFDLPNTVAVLLKAVQEMSLEMERLKEKVKQLEAK